MTGEIRCKMSYLFFFLYDVFGNRINQILRSLTRPYDVLYFIIPHRIIVRFYSSRVGHVIFRKHDVGLQLRLG